MTPIGTGAHANILLIEDCLADATVMMAAFSQQNLPSTIHHVTHGQAAIEFLDSQYRVNRLPDLIILDLGLPGLSGQEVLEKIHGDDRFSDILVVVFTAYPNPEEQFNQAYSEVVAYLTKPHDMKLLFETVRSLYRLVA